MTPTAESKEDETMAGKTPEEIAEMLTAEERDALGRVESMTSFPGSLVALGLVDYDHDEEGVYPGRTRLGCEALSIIEAHP